LGCPLAMDEGDRGSLSNHDAAWRLGCEAGGDYVVVLEDDVMLVDGFERHAAEALANVPGEGAVSFYTGTTRPHPARVSQAVRKAEAAHVSWLQSSGSYWGPALALPTELVGPMLRAVAEVSLPYDERLSVFLRRSRMPCFYT